MTAICVYCGSRNGDHPAYLDAARLLGQLFADQNITLIYGGASVGLMGTLADTILDHGGQIIGVIPECLMEREVAHPHLSKLITVDAMHTRKLAMMERADGFITLPGGTGTLDELFETLTLSHLQQHNKPCGLLNINGYYDSLITFLEHTVNAGFVVSSNHQRLLISAEPAELVKQIIESA